MPVEHDAVGVPATFGVRAGARVIDTIVGLIMGLAVGLPTGVLLVIFEQTGLIGPSWQTKMGGLSFGSVALSFAGTMAYHSLSESVGGASLGKWICGLRVYGADFSPDGTLLLGLRPCSFGAALVRSLAILVDGLFCGAVAYSSMSSSASQQRLGDSWGRTVVVKAKSTKERGGSPAIGVLLGLAMWSVFLILGILVKLL